MIKAVLDSPNGKKFYFLGLSEENIKRLKEGQPISFSGAEMGLPGHFIIVWGPTEEIIETQLRAGQVGKG